ncbi:MAG: hypothetical protein AAF223_03320 [Bacteroidota bacterium]
MHTKSNLHKSLKSYGFSIPVILFIVFFGLGYSIGVGDTTSPENIEEQGSSSIFLIDSGRFSFPMFPLPLLNMK